MRYPIIFAALLAMSCGSADSKTGDLTNNVATNNVATNNVATNNAATNNVTTNNVTTNNVTTNNVATNNSGLELCGPDPSPPERQLGLTGVAIEGEASALVVGVESDRLALLVEDVEAQFFFEGGDLTELFRVEDRVSIVVIERGTPDQGYTRVQSIAGERGMGAELGWSVTSAIGGEPAPATLELPLAAATISLGGVVSAATCLSDGGCAPQPRTRASNDVAVEYRNELESVAIGADLLDDEYSFRNLSAGSTSYAEVTGDVCSIDGSTRFFFTVSSWGRVFL